MRRKDSSKLASLKNEVIKDIYENLKKDDATLHPLSAPTEVYKFVEFCKNMLEEFRVVLDVL